jgi:hypothetical protein
MLSCALVVDAVRAIKHSATNIIAIFFILVFDLVGVMTSIGLKSLSSKVKNENLIPS